jgi:hypothetical protein
MRLPALFTGLVASLAVLAGSDIAGAQPYYYHHYVYYHHHYYYRHYYPHYAYARCGYQRHRAGNIGAVSGAVGGGIIGAALTHGNPAYTMVGAGLGAFTGHAIGRNSHPYGC